MVRKVIIGIFISFFCIFLMSYNASAVEAVFDISNYDLINNYISQSLTCTYNDDLTSTGGTCSLNGTRYALKEVAFPARDYENGDIIQFDIITSSYTSFTTGENASGYYSMPYRTPYIAANADYRSISIDTLQFESNERLINYYNEWNCRVQGTADNCTGYPELTNSGANYQAFRVTLRIRRKITNGSLVIAGGNAITNYFMYLPGYNIGNNSSEIVITRFNIWRPIETQENKEVEQKTQDAVDDSEDSGNSSQSSVEGSTQSLMSAGGSIISALVNAQATDCNINVQTTGSSRLFTTAIGQLNLCSDVPQGVLTMVQGIVALVFTPIVLYFTYNVLTTLYNQFKEYNS